MNKFNIYGHLAETLVNCECYTATKFISPVHIIRATRKVYNRRIDKRRNVEIMFTDGRPNYHARQHIKLLKKAGEPFPVKKILLTFFPKRRKK